MSNVRVILNYKAVKYVSVNDPDQDQMDMGVELMGANAVCECIYDILVGNDDAAIDLDTIDGIITSNDIRLIKEDKDEILGDSYIIEDVEIDSVRGLMITLVREGNDEGK